MRMMLVAGIIESFAKTLAVFCVGPFDFFNFILKHQMLHMFLLCVEFRLQTIRVTVLFILFVKNRYVQTIHIYF